MAYLPEVVLILFAFAIAAPLGKLSRVGSVLAFVATGILIGPWGLRLVDNSEDILRFAEIGVVFLLFVIGLELQPKRLWAMRKYIFLAGSYQVFGSLALGWVILYFLNFTWQQCLVIAFGLSLSSTPFALHLLADKNELQTTQGRLAFSILLFQDLAVIPFLAMFPLLATGDNPAVALGNVAGWQSILFFSVFIVAGRFLLIPWLRMIAWTRVQESFTAMALLLVIGSALFTEQIGLSMGLGAFIAGVLVADSEYRPQLEADIDPFKSLLLGLFFLAVGMSANLGALVEQFLTVFIGLGLLFLVKVPVLFVLGRSYALNTGISARLAAYLFQGGEFGFVAFTLAASYLIFPAELGDVLILVVILSMAITPLMLKLADLFVVKKESQPGQYKELMLEEDLGHKVIIAGFGRFGQILGRVLSSQNIPYTAIDMNPEQVKLVRDFGNKVYFGDARKRNLLEKANIAQARILALCFDDIKSSLAIIALVRRHYPQIKIFARARDRNHELQLRNAGVDYVIRETLMSGLKFSESVLHALNVDAEKAALIVRAFQKHDHHIMERQLARLKEKAVEDSAEHDPIKELQALLNEDKDNKVDPGSQ